MLLALQVQPNSPPSPLSVVVDPRPSPQIVVVMVVGVGDHLGVVEVAVAMAQEMV